ncbi:hypothetical protein MPH_09200 [Macrophomina phaseolina MS6]|uniref:Short chain dehydrogenase/reductase dpmpH n=1 Tax=Macrophomina phaseolina (strain MS6) TaxID=1126212 RepID=DPMPH_MACPH|nr:RecName: Full=Short chain dehydrogenase/reductase dpmpH; AltName: Full=Diterpenoid pyrone biosynthesis cluster protein H [Macrophomina phaseolina MS6]EKG13734.1 hypothetical protein MPH_09200 [Macrophomina phaseolina MS6]
MSAIGHSPTACSRCSRPRLRRKDLTSVLSPRLPCFKVSSSGEAFATDKADFITPKDLDDPCASPGWEASSLAQAKRYGKSKMANVLFAAELQRRMDAEGVDIISISLNPGPVKTQGAADVLPFMVRPMVWLFFKDPAEGAQTTLFAAAAAEIREEKERWKGGYLDGPGKLKSPSPRARDPQVAYNLWHTTESAVRAIGVLDKS